MDNITSVPVQFWSLIWSTIIIVAFSFYIFNKIKKQDPNEPPTKFVALFEMYVEGFDNLFSSVTGGRLKKVFPYFFALFNFILWTSFISLLGFEPAPSSIAFTFTLGFITFLGIYIIGIGTYGFFRYFRNKYKNPAEIVSQFSPLLSISLRLFGATVATAVIGDIFVIILANLFPDSIAAEVYPVVSVFWSWVWTFIDSFLTIVQAFVFTILTAIYWSSHENHGPSWKRSERQKHFKAEKELKKQIKNENKKKINN